MEPFSQNHHHTTRNQHYIPQSQTPCPQYYPPVNVYGSPTATVDFSRKYYNSPPTPPHLFLPPSRPPFASIENIRTPVKFCTSPVKVEEDVLVMDGILIDSASPPGNARLVKSPLEHGPLSHGSGNGRLVESKSPGNGSGRLVKPSHLSPRNANNLYNSQFAQGKEDLRSTRYSNINKPEFAQGKEDLRSTRYSNIDKSEFALGKENVRLRRHFSITKPEGLMCRPLTLEGSSTNGTEIRSDHPEPAANEITLNPKLDESTGSSNWLPIDDQIGVKFPYLLADESPSRKAIDACIQAILYGPRKKQRLPVFKEICPE